MAEVTQRIDIDRAETQAACLHRCLIGLVVGGDGPIISVHIDIGQRAILVIAGSRGRIIDDAACGIMRIVIHLIAINLPPHIGVRRIFIWGIDLIRRIWSIVPSDFLPVAGNSRKRIRRRYAIADGRRVVNGLDYRIVIGFRRAVVGIPQIIEEGFPERYADIIVQARIECTRVLYVGAERHGI